MYTPELHCEAQGCQNPVSHVIMYGQNHEYMGSLEVCKNHVQSAAESLMPRFNHGFVKSIEEIQEFDKKLEEDPEFAQEIKVRSIVSHLVARIENMMAEQ